MAMVKIMRILPVIWLLPATMMPVDDAWRVGTKGPPGLFVTVYDWGLGGINCDGDCSNTALTTTGDELLGWTAACPSAWLGHVTTTVVTIWGKEYWCIDAFGQPEHRVLTEVDGVSVYRIDLAFRPAAEHPWNQEFVPGESWSVEWRSMAEFDRLREEHAATP